MRSEGYDVIGDVHGCGRMLADLLGELGYEERNGAFWHPRRQVVFVGDLIDRGPEQKLTVAIARSMVDAGSAKIVAGNHEFNAIAYTTENPASPGHYLRDHETKGYQHKEFIEQIGFGTSLHLSMIDWFLELPLWLELDGLRVVHACWDQHSINSITGLLADDQTMDLDFVERASREGTVEYAAVEMLLKGPEIDVTPGYLDKGGTVRDHARFTWWDPDATTLQAGAFIPPGSRTADGQPYPELPADTIDRPVEAYRSTTPLFYGHYWESGTPNRSGKHTACVDYSAVNGGSLVAYRWSGESELTNDNFVAVPAT
jgi:hypothetical protein